jgi:hypothetical protein
MPSGAGRELKTLLDGGLERWDEYLRQFEEGKPITVLSMEMVFQKAAVRAQEQISLEWAGIALRAADLFANQGGGKYRESALLEAMRLRAWFISKMGSRPGHPILDKEIILRWFTAELKFSLDVAKDKAAKAREKFVTAMKFPTPENKQLAVELLDLRRIKHRLTIVKTLAECGELPGDSPLNEWLKIRELLI